MAHIIDEIPREKDRLCPFCLRTRHLARKVRIAEIGADVRIRHLCETIPLQRLRQILHIDIVMLRHLPMISIIGSIDTDSQRRRQSQHAQELRRMPKGLGQTQKRKRDEEKERYDLRHHISRHPIRQIE